MLVCFSGNTLPETCNSCCFRTELNKVHMAMCYSIKSEVNYAYINLIWAFIYFLTQLLQPNHQKSKPFHNEGFMHCCLISWVDAGKHLQQPCDTVLIQRCFSRPALHICRNTWFMTLHIHGCVVLLIKENWRGLDFVHLESKVPSEQMMMGSVQITTRTCLGNLQVSV